jgi:LCP family protein required for cell wall assembly
MPDAPGPEAGPRVPHAYEPPPTYTKYRSRPRLTPRRQTDALAELRARGDAPDGKRRTFGGRKPWTWQRGLKWFGIVVFGWIALSVVLFLVSAQIQAGGMSQATKDALDPAGYPLTSANNILVLGSDQRVKGTKEPGASTEGPSRSDSIMLLRVGGGHNSRLSVARDTVVNIPGHGASKINAAYAYGGAPLAIETIKQYLGVEVNHVIEVNFDRFPGLINALGGVTYEGECVLSRINGGTRNGGYTLRLKKGKTHINGNQALALARTRKNICQPQETDLDRAKRQQFLLTAMKDKLTSFGGLFGIPNGAFYRLPLIGWRTPRAFSSDMNGFTLAGVFAAMGTGGAPSTQVLGTLTGNVPEAEKNAAVKKFLAH